MMHSDPTESLEERLARYGAPLRTTPASPAEVVHRRRSYRRSVVPAAAVVAAAVLAGGLLAQRSEAQRLSRTALTLQPATKSPVSRPHRPPSKSPKWWSYRQRSLC